MEVINYTVSFCKGEQHTSTLAGSESDVELPAPQSLRHLTCRAVTQSVPDQLHRSQNQHYHLDSWHSHTDFFGVRSDRSIAEKSAYCCAFDLACCQVSSSRHRSENRTEVQQHHHACHPFRAQTNCVMLMHRPHLASASTVHAYACGVRPRSGASHPDFEMSKRTRGWTASTATGRTGRSARRQVVAPRARETRPAVPCTRVIGGGRPVLVATRRQDRSRARCRAPGDRRIATWRHRCRAPVVGLLFSGGPAWNARATISRFRAQAWCVWFTNEWLARIDRW
jgi:hypothetical protein